MSRPGRRYSWWLTLLPLVLLPACEPRKIEIEGLDELTSEIRSQRMHNSRRPAAKAGSGKAIPTEQIQAAMSPLREVLAQLAASQKDLSSRQATLTKEMQQWTHLLVQSMQETRTTEANKLSKRLQELEQSIAAQDERHREVEDLMGSALDRTADQLEEFLRRVGAGVPNGKGPPDEKGAPDQKGPANQKTAPKKAGGSPGTNGTTNKTPSNNAGSGEQPAGGQDPSGAGAPGDGQQASMRWLWWTLALFSVGSGVLLLRGHRRPRPVAMAPEMQVAPAMAKSEPEVVAQGPAEALSEPVATAVAASTDADDKEREVEELWAAAALLGEAIGRLKQTGEGSGEEVQSDAPPEHTRSLDDLDLDEMFVIDECEDEIPEPAPLPRAAVGDAADALDTPIQPEIESAADIEGPSGHEGPAEPEEPFAIPRPEAEAPREPVTDPVVRTPKARQDRVTEAVRAPAARHASQAPVTCSIHLRGDDQTEGRVRQLLGSDPRVLISPAPRVHNTMGELEVSFALLPGLPAGERSLLEQQLRDTVA